jgi:8-oxo-dGTP pyrophosphatase MutT (NUDIX family)
MIELQKATAFVVTKNKPRRLLVFQHPIAGIQLPAGTVEPGEDVVAAAAREVFEETGLKMTDPGRILREQTRRLEPDQAALLKTVEIGAATFLRGHKVRVLDKDKSRGTVRIREEIYDYNLSPPRLQTATETNVPADCLASTINRTFVLFTENAHSTARWPRPADGHVFEVFWTPLRPDIPLFESQQEWLSSNYELIETALNPDYS